MKLTELLPLTVYPSTLTELTVTVPYSCLLLLSHAVYRIDFYLWNLLIVILHNMYKETKFKLYAVGMPAGYSLLHRTHILPHYCARYCTV